MKFLKTTTENQTISFIPREYILSATIQLRDDSTNESTFFEATFTQSGDYLEYTGSFNLKEGRFYDLNISIDKDVWNQNTDNWELADYEWDEDNFVTQFIYRDKIFVSDQTLDQNNEDYYSINEGQYESETTFDNDYIIL